MAVKTLLLLGIMNLFLIIFLLSYINILQGEPMLNIMPVKIENQIIMCLCVLGILKTIFDMRK
jgi:hypothetical protein